MWTLRTNLPRVRRLFSPSFTGPGFRCQDRTLTRDGPSRYNEPPSAEFVARVSGIPTMARLPHRETADGLDAAFVGVPIDTGTSNRPGARSGSKVRSTEELCAFTFVPPGPA